jgi:hypothetical protein
MSETQFYVSVAVMPTVTVIIVLIGVLLNNTNMNARLHDLRGDMNLRFEDLRNEMNARIGELRDTLRAEMSKNHSEMLTKFAELDSRLYRLEAGSN